MKITKEEIVRLYKSGVSIRQISRENHVARETIRKYLAEANVNVRPLAKKVSDESLCQDYINGISVEDLAQKYKVGYKRVRKILDRNDIEIRGSLIKFSEDDLSKIATMYESGYSVKDVGNEFGVSETPIYRVLDELNISTRTNSESSRRYRVDEHYFDDIDNQDKAYILGFLYADGCNSSTRVTISLSLQARDRHILEDIRDLIYPDKDRPLIFKKRRKPHHQDVLTLVVESGHMSDRLYELGVVHNKAKIIQFPYFLSDELVSHFVRGYFDGDGSIHITKSENKTIFNLASSSLSFLESIQEILIDNCELNKVKIRQNNQTGVYGLFYAGSRQNTRIFHYLYDNSNLKLFRKYEKFKQGVSKYL